MCVPENVVKRNMGLQEFEGVVDVIQLPGFDLGWNQHGFLKDVVNPVSRWHMRGS